MTILYQVTTFDLASVGIVFFTVAAVFHWLVQFASPMRRAAGWFVYNHDSDPTAFDRWHHDSPVSLEPAASLPSVTVIVPGRNEGHLLNTTLRSICQMDYPGLRVVFINDQSTDNTHAVCDALQAEFPHLTVIHNTTPPPAGWVGKVWAIHQARDFVTTDYILFTDSDLEFHQQCLRQMMRLALHRRTDLLSLLPFLRVVEIGETLGMLGGMWLIGMKYPLSQSNDPAHPNCITAGGFLLFKRTAYKAIGGHEAVRGQVVEDIALGRITKNKKFRVFTVATQDLMGGRMYEGSADAFRGLKKNAYAGANYSPGLFIVGVLFLLFIGALVPIYPLAALLLWLKTRSVWVISAAIAGFLATILQILVMRRSARLLSLPTYSMWLGPAAAAFYLLVFTGSMIDHHRGGNTWAGRKMHAKDVDTLATIEKSA